MSYIINFAFLLENWIPYPGITKVLSFAIVMITVTFLIVILSDILVAIRNRTLEGLSDTIIHRLGSVFFFSSLIIIISFGVVASISWIG